MDSRPNLQALLETILGSRNVYFQPPESVKMQYPAIVYSRRGIDNNFANNAVYGQSRNYEVVVIDPDPDSEVVSKISKLPLCSFNRHYEKDNLNHDVFILYH